MGYKNPKDQKAYVKEHYRLNKAQYIARAKANKVKQVLRNRYFLERYKLLCGCKLCGFKKHAAALDLHHLGDKDQTVARMANCGVSIKKLRHEIRKCIVLCANCHRIEHCSKYPTANESRFNNTHAEVA